MIHFINFQSVLNDNSIDPAQFLSQQQMFFKKYKLLKNNGLLPKIDQPKTQSFLTTYCLLNEQKQRQYKLMRSPSDRNTVIMFNDKQYLHRKCSYLTAETSCSKILSQIKPFFPNNAHTLTIFIANAPRQCDGLLLGYNPTDGKGKQEDSLIGMAYHNIIANKSEKSIVKISIMGIESENCLTDELNQEWLDHQPQEESAPLETVVRSKKKVKVLKQHDSSIIITQNLTPHDIPNELKLREILQQYKDVKTHLEDWIINNQSPEFYLLGELYNIAEIKPASKDEPEVILQNHYILRVNQYFRMASPLMLRLGIHLRRAQEEPMKQVEMNESKLFKLLSQCFSNTSEKNGKRYHLHMFLQLGEYPLLKDQYLCLVPTSQYLHKNQAENLKNIIQSEFFYTKQIMEYSELHVMITNLINRQSSSTNSILLPQISGVLKARLKTKSYVCDTYCSQEKRIGKFRHMATEESHDRSQMELEELVYEAAKIYKLPSPKKSPTIVIKDNLTQIRKAQKNASLFQRSPDKLQKEVETNFEKRRKEDSFQNSRKDLPSKKFYQETKQWLGLIYGKNSSKKLQLVNKRVQRFDKTTNLLIQDMLSKQMNGAEEEIDEVIDRI